MYVNNNFIEQNKQYIIKTQVYPNCIEYTCYPRCYEPKTMRIAKDERLENDDEIEFKETEKIAQNNDNHKRAKDIIKSIALANYGRFKYFFTGTLSEEYQTKDLDQAKEYWQNYVHQYFRKKGIKLDYLIIFEYHPGEGSASGTIHYHGLLGEIPKDYLQYRGKEKNRHVWQQIHFKYGRNSVSKISTLNAIANYIRKYITKNTDFPYQFGKSRYLVSQGLNRPQEYYMRMEWNNLNNLVLHSDNIIAYPFKMNNQEMGKIFKITKLIKDE